MIDLDLLLDPLLHILPYLAILFFEYFALLVYLRKFFFYFNHQLLVSNNHDVSEENELIVIRKYVSNVLHSFFFDHFCLHFASKSIQIGFKDVMSLFANF